MSCEQLATSCCDNVLKENTPPPPQVIAVRFTANGINELMGSSLDYLNEPHWQVITHFIYHCLNISMSGDVCFGMPLLYRGTEDITQVGDSVLQNPETYIPVIENLVELNPQMNVAFSLPSCEDNSFLKSTLENYSLQVLRNLKMLVIKSKCVNLIEIDSSAFDILLSNETQWALLTEIPVKWLVTLSNNESVGKNFTSKILKLKAFKLLEGFIIKSYGHLRVARCPTSHGTYQTMILHPESSLSDFRRLYDMHAPDIGSNFVIMDIDTCGVEFMRSKNHGAYVGKFRLSSLKEIRKLRNFGKKTYYENYDADNGCSMLEFHQERRAISYDNDQVRSQKIDFIHTHNLKGVVIGELHNDLPPNHQQSLFATYLNRLMSPDSLESSV